MLSICHYLVNEKAKTMDRFLLADNPRTNRGLSIVHMMDPVAIIIVDEGHVNTGKKQKHFEYDYELYTLSMHHFFTTNMAGLDDKIGNEMTDKLLSKAWHWFKSYLQWEDEQIDENN